MGFIAKLKEKFQGKAKEAATKLGIDDAIVTKFEELVDKLEKFEEEGKLNEAATSAVASFKEAIASFKENGLDASALLEKAKGLLGNLKDIELPDEIKGIVEKVKGLIK